MNIEYHVHLYYCWLLLLSQCVLWDTVSSYTIIADTSTSTVEYLIVCIMYAYISDASTMGSRLAT